MSFLVSYLLCLVISLLIGVVLALAILRWRLRRLRPGGKLRAPLPIPDPPPPKPRPPDR